MRPRSPLQAAARLGARPTDPTALVLTITAVAPAQPGNLIAYPAEAPYRCKLADFVAGQVVANTTVTPSTPGSGSTFALFDNSDGTTEMCPVVMSIGGYFRGSDARLPKASSTTSATSGQQAFVALHLHERLRSGRRRMLRERHSELAGAHAFPAGDGYRCPPLRLAQRRRHHPQSMCCRIACRAGIDSRRESRANGSAGAATTITLPATASLAGSANDDGLPSPPAHLTVGWSKVSGPGNVAFADTSAATTSASFTQPGAYVLRLSASDSVLTSTSDVAITVNAALTAQTSPDSRRVVHHLHAGR